MLVALLSGMPGCMSISCHGFGKPMMHGTAACCDAEETITISDQIQKRWNSFESASALSMPNLRALPPGPIRRCWYGVHAAMEKHREEANAPPWPKFHPLPVEPAFTPRDRGLQPAPDAYGHFGPEE